MDENCLSLDIHLVGWVVAIGSVGLWLCFLLFWAGLGCLCLKPLQVFKAEMFVIQCMLYHV